MNKQMGKRVLALVLSSALAFSALPATGVFAEETPEARIVEQQPGPDEPGQGPDGTEQGPDAPVGAESQPDNGDGTAEPPPAAGAPQPEETAASGEEREQKAPESITIEYIGSQKAPNNSLIGKTGDTFPFRALDQNGNETPVTWKNGFSWAGTLDEASGLFTAANLTAGGSSTLYLTATSTLDSTVKAEGRFTLTGYQMSQWNKTPTVALSEDGQTAKTISASGGYDGCNLWAIEGAEGIARLSNGQDLNGKKGSVKFDALRPGTFTASFALDFDESMTDTATLTITGVAVEAPGEAQGKTYLTLSAASPKPTVQLTAYTEEGHSVSGWSSSNGNIATVDGTGLVTAQGVGTALVTATDDQGKKGGIKIVVESGETPYFENLQFLASALSDWNASSTFSATKLEYPLTIRSYSTTKLTLQATTLYDSGKYTATASYPSIGGRQKEVPVNSGATTYLEDIPFDQFDLTVTLAEKANPENQTVYTFHATRPRDTANTLRAAVFQPVGRPLSSIKYQGQNEGTLFRLNEDGNLMQNSWGNFTTGFSNSHFLYKCYALDGLSNFSLNLTGGTAYAHLRYSTDNGVTWIELPQGGGNTGAITFPVKTGEENAAVEVQVNILDDKTYSDNIKAGKDGFADSEGKTYTIIAEQVSLSSASVQISKAETNCGDWYPAFAPSVNSYTIIAPKGEAVTLQYAVPEGVTVKLSNTEQIPGENGIYTLPLTGSQQTLTLSSADGSASSSYSFLAKSPLEGGADRIVDYLCLNSQYTNGSYGGNPVGALYGNMVSIGNFGGYLTCYFENGLTDSPDHLYGLDFYINGNANRDTSTATKTSFFEPGQVYVSEDGETWYALAGSAHYEEGVDWDYTVTYAKTASGKTAWTDSHGNSNNGEKYTGVWPSSQIYFFNDLIKNDSFAISGIALPARSGSIAVSGETVDAYPIQWGYADCLVNGENNPYLDNSNFDLASNGFDLAWAVDENGLPVDVSGKEFHYVKVQTVSNIWHPSFGEKSPEISGILRAEAQSTPVGQTALPTGITVSDGVSSKTLNFTKGQQVYTLDLGDMKYVSIKVNGAAADDNVYINNYRTTGEAVSGFKATKETEKLVRILVQNGDKEPVICLVRLQSSASSGGDLIEGVRINAGGSIRAAETRDGKNYTASVGYRMDSVRLLPTTAPEVSLAVNGEALKESYALAEGENIFTITGEKDGITHKVTLKIIKEAQPAVTGKITVQFSLLGDTEHQVDEAHCHLLAGGGLQTWIPNASYTLDAPATVLDILEMALEGKYDFTNADGNYISEIGGLAEFTNGSLSGWMYTVNGSYSGKGVAEQQIRNGDVIVFHYTDDYTKERGSEQWNGGTNTGKDDTNASGAASANKAPAAEGVIVREYLSKDGKGSWKKYESGAWTLTDSKGSLLTGWQKVDGNWYYFQETGEMRTGRQEINGKTYFLRDWGGMRTGWFILDGVWLHCASSGELLDAPAPLPAVASSYSSRDNTGRWQKHTDGRWSFATEEGLASGWRKVDGRWYFFDTAHAMVTGWQYVNDNWYYLDASGAMKTGWQLLNGAWYYLNDSGSMKTGWLQDKGVWYYLLPSGAMLTDGKTPDGYFVDAAGRWA